jgi:hypothetical protein
VHAVLAGQGEAQGPLPDGLQRLLESHRSPDGQSASERHGDPAPVRPQPLDRRPETNNEARPIARRRDVRILYPDFYSDSIW